MRIEELSKKISSQAQLELDLSANEYQMMRYSLAIILNEVSKFLIIFLTFWLFQVHMIFLMGFLTLIMIRSNLGGLHFKTYWGCLGFSLIFFSISIYLYNHVCLSQMLMIGLGLLCLTITYIVSPVLSSSRPKYSASKKDKFKHLGCILIMVHVLGFITIKNNPYFTMSIWIIFLQTVQLIIAKGVNVYEEQKVS